MRDRCQCAMLFYALSDDTRQHIMEILSQGEMCVSEIGRHFDVAQPTISHHLDVLKRAGLVTSRKEGREVYYSLNVCHIVGCCGPFLSRFGLRLAHEE